MRGVRKAYDKDLDEWAGRAEREFVRRFLEGNGYEYTVYPDGKKGIDGEAKNDFEEFKVEVERSEMSRWYGDALRYATVHILERRCRYGDKKWMHFTVREDGGFAVITFPQSIRKERLKPNPNKFVRDGEYVVDVPIHETLRADLSDRSGLSIARRNAERIRAGVKQYRGAAAMQFLGDDPPYGLSESEWKSLRDEAEKPLRDAAYCNCKDERRTRGPDIYGRSGWFAEHCDKCQKFYGCGPKS